ncbi:uncharacterized protein LOC141714991 [Apium graveolens]|uniref:uncharacterized protein LOC141714991 n=1 Tax=Apium graveolens TaxID=4045 RepID=UPI003D7A8039
MANAFKSFKSVKPPEFHGVADPVQARAWLKEVEKTFERIGTEEAHKTNFATYLLKGEANYWWEAKKNMEPQGIVTWERFTELFLKKYVPKFMEIQMQRKFLELKQENMSVAEYEAKFIELSRFVPQLKATIAETGSEMSQKMKQTKKRKFDGRSRSVGGESSPSKFVRGTASQPNRSTRFGGSGSVSVAWSGNQTGMSYHSQPRPPLPECKSCGKKHYGECMQKPVTCFKCGKVGHYATACNQEAAKCFQCGKIGHMKKDCLAAAPASSRGSVAASNRVPTARTFNMTVAEPGTEGLYEMVMQPELLEKIRRCQEIVLRENKELVSGEEAKCEPDEKGIRRHAYRIWVPNVQELKDEILLEGHNSRYTVHPGSTKMYEDLKEYYWWPNMKKDCSGVGQ